MIGTLVVAAVLSTSAGPDVLVAAKFGGRDLAIAFTIKSPRGDRIRDRGRELLAGRSPSADGSDPLDRLVPNGKLWRVETSPASPHAAALSQALAAALDADGDRNFSRDELVNGAAVLLKKFDADGDECLTPLEIVPDLLTRQPPKATPPATVSVRDVLTKLPGVGFITTLDKHHRQRINGPAWTLDVVTGSPQPPKRSETPKALLRPGREAERARFEAIRDEVVTITIRHEPLGLFELLDADGDGQLSLRELRRGLPNIPRPPSRLPDPNLITQALTVIVTRGVESPPPVRLTKAPPPQRGPEWFRALDRNGDGDVSRKEFVGTDSQFKFYDADGDGLISADEAEAGDKKLKSGEKP